MQFLRQQQILLSIEADIRTETLYMRAREQMRNATGAPLPDPASELGVRIAAWERRVRNTLADVHFAHYIHQRHAKKAHFPVNAIAQQRRRATGIDRELQEIGELAGRIEEAIEELLDIFAYGPGREAAQLRRVTERLERTSEIKREWCKTLSDLKSRQAKAEASAAAARPLGDSHKRPLASIPALAGVAIAIEGLKLLIDRAWRMRRMAAAS